MLTHHFKLAALLILLTGLTSAPTPAANAERYNVLFICVDDLRPQLGAYGQTFMKTPHLDKFAAQSRLFNHHYVQVPTCGASRFALLTGKYPKTAAAFNNGAFKLLSSDPEKQTPTLPGVFRKAGYTTVSIGKVSHQPGGRVEVKEGGGSKKLGPPEVPFAWDQIHSPNGKWGDAWSAFFGYADGTGRKRGKSPTWESADVDDHGYPDGLIANQAIHSLRELKGKPFFLAVGFFKPHLPFNAPTKYFDLYDPDKLPDIPFPQPPEGGSKSGLHTSGELLGNYGSHPDGRNVTPKYAKQLRHAYFACVSYVDAQIGRVLNELERLELKDRTIIVIWGDHGWHLGDLSLWGKHTTYERSLRSALIIRTPYMPKRGTPTNAIVETIDLFPTLTDLCRIRGPKGLDGASLRKVLNDPMAGVKEGALGFWRNGNARTIRTEKYRLVEWLKNGKPDQYELYDLTQQFDERKNIAGDHDDLVKHLAEQLHKQYGE